VRPPGGSGALPFVNMHNSIASIALLASIAAGAAACGDDPVSYSEPVTINLKVKSSDASTGVVTDDKNITTEQSNPYGAFVANARNALGGAEPSYIDVDRVDLLLGARSTGVTALGQVFTGNVEVLFRMNDTNNSVPVAAYTMPDAAGSGPLAFGVAFDSDALGSADYGKLLGGSFGVVVRGPAAADFQSKGAEAELEVTLAFTAYE